MNNQFTAAARLTRISRRQFLHSATITAGATVIAGPALVRGRALNEKLNIGIIGAGGRGAANTQAISSENIVALCDVNGLNLAQAAARYPQARKYFDFRKMFEEAKDIDAVVVSTAEHTHALANLMAIKLGKHVYSEKPLTHCVWEARVVAEAAVKAKVATQMGTQIHAGDNYRRVVELIQTAAIGPVSEAHVWVSRAWGGGDRPSGSYPIPPHLHWDLWLGPAPARPYHPDYFPGPRWYKYWDFGSGTMSDLGSHWIDLPFWALKLRHPLTIAAEGPPVSPETAPASMMAVYEYGARGNMPPVKLIWYQGEIKPRLYTDGRIPRWGDGVLFLGAKGMLLADYGKHVLLPEAAFRDFKRPEPFIQKSLGHHAEWIAACKTGSPTTCNFDYSGALTEANHLGNVAYRVGKRLEWDPVRLEATNCPEASRYIRKEYRQGWSL
jgi:predicted dehydrogenase